jgi:hypothetical protein
MPADLRGKIILTNTTTTQDAQDLRTRGGHLRVTETPRPEGRTVGMNVIEALLLACIAKPQSEIGSEDFEPLIGKPAWLQVTSQSVLTTMRRQGEDRSG